jgi:GNAT superfamily N-acetyltransferase
MNPSFSIRNATPDDVPQLFELIKALAAYEKLSHLVTGTTAALEEHLFGERPYIEAIVAEFENKAVGFALFFWNYSTFLTKPGIYLEDIFVLPEYRRLGIGKALLTRVAKIASERNAGRLEWSVLDWNENAIVFYQRFGASVLPEWRICRITEDKLREF